MEEKMKKILMMIAGAAAAAAITGCASDGASAKPAEKQAEAPAEYVMPDDVISGAEGFDEEELSAKYNMTDAVLEKWSADSGKIYMKTGDLWSKIQYEDGTGDWQADILSKSWSSIDVGGEDKIIALDMKMNAHYGWIQNFSEQAKNPKKIDNAVWKMKIYIPEEYCGESLKDVPEFRFQVRDQSWNIAYLSGDIDKITTRDLGAGWHVLTINFADSTFDFGEKKGTFRVTKPRKANALELQINGKGFKTSYPFYIDWFSIDGLE